MMRFYRKKPTEQQVREKSSDISMNAVDSFRQEHNRYPNRSELDEISRSVFEQLKRDLDRKDSELDDIDLGEAEGGAKACKGRSLLEQRKAKRGAAKAGDGSAGWPSKTGKKSPAVPGAAFGASEVGNGGKKLPRSESRKLAKKGRPQGAEDDKKTGLGGHGDEDGLEGMGEGQGSWKDEGESKSGEGTGEGDESGSLEELEEMEKNRQGVKNLAAIDELTALEGELLGDDAKGGDGEFDLVEKELDAGGTACPGCGSKAGEIIYCPNCGDAFCDHCAKKVEPLSDSVKYTCGKCRAEFRKRKGRQ